MLKVEDVEPVPRVDLHSEALAVGLVQSLTNSAIIVEEESSVVHHLDHALGQGSCSGLRPFVHDGDLNLFLCLRAILLCASHSNC